jgi:hypothetical protein
MNHLSALSTDGSIIDPRTIPYGIYDVLNYAKKMNPENILLSTASVLTKVMVINSIE